MDVFSSLGLYIFFSYFHLNMLIWVVKLSREGYKIRKSDKEGAKYVGRGMVKGAIKSS